MRPGLGALVELLRVTLAGNAEYSTPLAGPPAEIIYTGRRRSLTPSMIEPKRPGRIRPACSIRTTND